jgi:ATP-dependent RNA helicase DDX51/DBP6
VKSKVKSKVEVASKDPQKLASLGLINPKHYDAHHLKGGSGTQRYSMPAALAKFTVECTAEQKPLVLVSLLLEQFQLFANDEASIVVVFTSSLDSTHRLVRLLQLIWASAELGNKQTAIAERAESKAKI